MSDGLTVGDLIEALDGLPVDASVSIEVQYVDVRRRLTTKGALNRGRPAGVFLHAFGQLRGIDATDDHVRLSSEPRASSKERSP